MRHELLENALAEPVLAQIPQDSCLVRKISPPTRYVVTEKLPRGSQAGMMAAATFSIECGAPINTLLTINAAHLQRIDEGGVFAIGHLWDGFQTLLELLRKWIVDRGVYWACIWVREWSKCGYKGNGQSGEHWHIAFHLPRCYRSALATQVAEWAGEDVGIISPKEALSVGRAWQLKSGRGGPESIAAYLGKAEPSNIKKYGKRVANPDKPRRDRVGGEGRIEGKRYGICKGIGATAQAKTGFKYHRRASEAAS